MAWMTSRLARLRERLPLLAVLLFAAVFFSLGIQWGLPSREADRFLFGERRPWTGPEIQAAISVAAPKWDDTNRGADLDADPIGQLPIPVTLTNDDAARAQIVRRYRLFTHQPDEMITLMSLAKMRPGKFDFDPRLYQYGGLWVYPVGMLLRAAASLGFVELRGGNDALAYYLDHPELFARFYMVARGYVVFWGVIAAWAVFAIVRMITGKTWAATLAGLAFCCMPVVVNMAHEAKPHLPGMALVLLTVLAGAKYVESGRMAHAMATAILAGCAVGMVLSAVPVLVVPVLMVILRPMPWGDRIRLGIFALVVAVVTYGVTNPYVVWHLLTGGSPLRSNLGNSKAFYSVGQLPEGVMNVGRLVALGTGEYIAVLGTVATLALAVRAWSVRKSDHPDEVRRQAHGLLLAAPAVLTAIQATLVAAGKPAEFARFLLLTDVFLLVEIFAWLGLTRRGSVFIRPLLGIAIVVTAVPLGWKYVQGFMRDSSPTANSRIKAAQRVAGMAGPTDGSMKQPLYLLAEPAPYSAPPMDLWRWDLIKLPKDADPTDQPGLGVWVRVEEGRANPISWADKPVSVGAGPIRFELDE